MGSKRSAGAAIVHEGDLYVFGGYNGDSCLQTAEVFHHKTQAWKALPDMSYGRCASGASLNNRLYVVGGCVALGFGLSSTHDFVRVQVQ